MSADDAHLRVDHGHLWISRFWVVETEHNRGQPLHVPSAGLPHNFLATGGEEGEAERGDGYYTVPSDDTACHGITGTLFLPKGFECQRRACEACRLLGFCKFPH